MKLYITQTIKKEIDRIMVILGDARLSIGKLGIDQWQYGYPSRDIIKDDILKGFSYAVREEKDGEIIATFCIKRDEEPTYKEIFDGSWLNNGKYFALHRIAICEEKRGTGVSSEIINFIVKTAVESGAKSIKVDTHEGNLPMRKMLEKNGFIYCGIIYLKTGEERVAYERIV